MYMYVCMYIYIYIYYIHIYTYVASPRRPRIMSGRAWAPLTSVASRFGFETSWTGSETGFGFWTGTGTVDECTPGLHNKIPAHKIFARVWVAQEPFVS